MDAGDLAVEAEEQKINRNQWRDTVGEPLSRPPW
jgi:hypothetical protein